MTLSEAIRLGAMLKPQGFRSMASYASSHATCALGAAADALGLACGTALDLRYPWLSKRIEGCDVGGTHRCREIETLLETVWHLNDQHRWTREQIADWVETIEQQQELTRAGDRDESLGGTPDAKGPEPTRTAATEVGFESQAPAPVRVEA